MASLNSVSLIGNVGKSPEVKTLTGGDKVANFSMAMGESWTDKKSGEKKEKTEWVNIVVWGDGLCNVVEKYVLKGSRIYIQGQLRTRKYEKDGSDRYATEVVVQGMSGRLLLLDRKEGGETSNQSRHERPAETGGGGGYDDAMSDDIPFATMFSIR